MSQKKYVIVGSSAAGSSAVIAITRLDPLARIIWITQEAVEPYNKCLLGLFLSERKTKEEIALFDKSGFNFEFITRKYSQRVIGIVHAQQKIVLGNGEEISYDKLLLATGVEPHHIPIDIALCRNVLRAHELRDFEKIKLYLDNKQVKTIVIIGAGLTGIEIASVLAQSDRQIILLEKKEQILINFLEKTEAAWLVKKIQNHVRICTQMTIIKYIVDDNLLKRLSFPDQTFLEPDLVIFAHGARPSLALAQSAELAVDNGILVDEYFKTSNNTIFAAGDCAELPDGSISSTWAEAIVQGRVAAENMVHEKKKYQRLISVSFSSFFGLRFIAFGKRFDHSRIVHSTHDMLAVLVVNHEFCIVGFVLVGMYPEAFEIKLKRAVQCNSKFDSSIWLI